MLGWRRRCTAQPPVRQLGRCAGRRPAPGPNVPFAGADDASPLSTSNVPTRPLPRGPRRARGETGPTTAAASAALVSSSRGPLNVLLPPGHPPVRRPPPPHTWSTRHGLQTGRVSVRWSVRPIILARRLRPGPVPPHSGSSSGPHVHPSAGPRPICVPLGRTAAASRSRSRSGARRRLGR